MGNTNINDKQQVKKAPKQPPTKVAKTIRTIIALIIIGIILYLCIGGYIDYKKHGTSYLEFIEKVGKRIADFFESLIS